MANFAVDKDDVEAGTLPAFKWPQVSPDTPRMPILDLIGQTIDCPQCRTPGAVIAPSLPASRLATYWYGVLNCTRCGKTQYRTQELQGFVAQQPKPVEPVEPVEVVELSEPLPVESTAMKERVKK